MSSNKPSLALEDVKISLIEMGVGKRAIPVLEEGLRQMLAGATGEVSFELEDLIAHLKTTGFEEIASFIEQATARAYEKIEKAERLKVNAVLHGGDLVGAANLADPNDLFLRIAHAYESKDADRRRRYAHIAELVRPGETVVDIGCGDGLFLELVRERGARGIGIDLDEAKVAIARSKGIEAHVGLAQQIDWNWGDVDMVTMLHLIEHLPPREALDILAKARDSLSATGRIFLLTPNITLPVVQSSFWLDITHIRPYPEMLLQAIMDGLGFETITSGTAVHDCETWVLGSLERE